MNKQFNYKHSIMKFSLSIILLTVIALTASAEPSNGKSNILLFIPGGTYSHKLGVWSLMTALADKGHVITVLSSHPKSPSKHPNIKSVVPKVLSEYMKEAYNRDRFEDRRLGKEFELWTEYHGILVDTCKMLLDPKSRNDPEYSKFLDAKFDLVIINAIYGDCGFIFAHHYNTKYIVYHSAVPNLAYPDSFGIPIEAAWLPDVMTTFNNPLTLWDKFINVCIPLYWTYLKETELYSPLATLMKEHLKLNYTPDYEPMERNSKIVLYNGHYSTDFARSVPPNFIPVGGMSLWEQEKPIPEPFNSFLNSAGEGGAVFISFGSSIDLSAVPDYYKFMFLNLITKFNKIKFILKWNGDLPQNYQKPENLLHSDWLPQKEILRHSNLKAFITHGGLNSVQEATYYGIPLIVLPLFADQDFNAYRVVAQEIGLSIEIREITPTLLENHLKSILSDPKYKKNMVIKSKLFRDRERSPIDTAVYWTEFVLRHDDFESLKPLSVSLTWYQKRLLDVYFVVFAVVTIFFLLICFISIKVLKMLFGNVNIPKATEKSKKGKSKQH